MTKRKDIFKWRNLEEERQKAMRKLEERETQRESYANKFSTKREVRIFPAYPKKNKYLKRLYKKALILSQKINEKRRG